MGPEAKAPKRRITGYVGFIGLLISIFLCPYLLPQSQDEKKETSHKDQPSYGVKVNSVVISATVTDKAGNPVTDLTANDFKLYDDGKPQKIQTFEMESFGPPEPEETKETKAAGASPKRAASEQNAGRPRLISIVIDDLTMDTALGVNTYLEFPRMLDAVKKFISNDVGRMDQVAILSGSRRVQFPFSNDKQRLLEEVSAVLPKLNPDTTQEPCDLITDLEAWQISGSFGINQSPYFRQLASICWDELSTGKRYHDEFSGAITSVTTADNDSAMSIRMDPRQEEYLRASALRTNGDSEFRTRNLLYTILQNIRTLKHFEGTRMVVFFSDGFITQKGTPAAYQLQELIDMALRSGIVLNTVSTRSISAELANAPWVDVMRQDNIKAQHSPLAQMAEETGGVFSNNNNMYKPLQTIASRKSFYYILTYAMPPHKAAGSYNKIKLEVTRPGLEISYRKGYYTPKEELSVQSGKKEDIMDALNAPGNMNEIPMTLSYNYSQQDDSTYAVSFITNVNIHNLQFPEEDNRRKNQISLVLAAFDENDHYISGLEKAIDFQLLESSYAGLRESGLTSRVELKIPMGLYKVKAVVRENVQGKMGSIAKSVQIP